MSVKQPHEFRGDKDPFVAKNSTRLLHLFLIDPPGAKHPDWPRASRCIQPAASQPPSAPEGGQENPNTPGGTPSQGTYVGDEVGVVQYSTIQSRLRPAGTRARADVLSQCAMVSLWSSGPIGKCYYSRLPFQTTKGVRPVSGIREPFCVEALCATNPPPSPAPARQGRTEILAFCGTARQRRNGSFVPSPESRST